jgi:hypothetical protein
MMLLALALACPWPAAQADAPGLVLNSSLQQTPQSGCLSREKAEAEAGSLALKSAQTYCRSEGFGWRAASVKDFGSLDCRRCDNGQFSCGHAKVALECRKAEPKLTWLGWFSAGP